MPFVCLCVKTLPCRFSLPSGRVDVAWNTRPPHRPTARPSSPRLLLYCVVPSPASHPRPRPVPSRPSVARGGPQLSQVEMESAVAGTLETFRGTLRTALDRADATPSAVRAWRPVGFRRQPSPLAS